MTGFTYLASPYTHSDPAVREQRYRDACRAAAALMSRGDVVFSPIAHSHPIELAAGVVNDGEFWKRQDAPYLEACTKLLVLMLPGWKHSTGVYHEVDRAMQRGIPIEYVEPAQLFDGEAPPPSPGFDLVEHNVGMRGDK